ncbi:unextended protein-like [Daphnia pulicaria]|uniref:unextended protein-like n=1 Tax=Daphnia pulicaria TaxID=35523 RepID=UPI001EEA891D|nr:unextended protein-like [Daphnia pulicaria]
MVQDTGRSWNIYRRFNSATSSTNSTPVDLFGLKPDDFEFLRVLDRGSFSQVLLAHQGLREKGRGATAHRSRQVPTRLLTPANWGSSKENRFHSEFAISHTGLLAVVNTRVQRRTGLSHVLRLFSPRTWLKIELFSLARGPELPVSVPAVRQPLALGQGQLRRERPQAQGGPPRRAVRILQQRTRQGGQNPQSALHRRPARQETPAPAFYICSLERANGHSHWTHQGSEPGLKVRTYQRALPLWIQVIIIVFLMAFSGLFSGLNLGLMALDRTELKIYENTGTDKEKQYAKTISPVRNHGNYLLCTLLLGNVLVNNSLTILLDDLTSGIVAIIGSTVGIVIFGEIIPQAICSRHGLAIGAHTVWITKFFMLITFPMSYPISLILDRILGEELGAYYNRERLKELIKVTKEYHDLEKEEVNIIAGALELRRKTVGDIMTRLEDVFMLSYDSLLYFETVSEIMKQGFSRVPIYDGERNNIIGLLFIKELALVDPQDAIPLKTLCRFYKNQCNFIFEDTTLDIMFKEFKEGHKGHMAFVQRVNCQGDGDPFYETVGLVTLEDIIEELIQAEIVDETDVWMDNRSKRRREKGRLFQDFSGFALQYHEQTAHKISPQLALAAFQFLSSSIDLFKTELISNNVLRRLMQQSQIIRFIRVNKEKSEFHPAETLIFQQGKPADYFVLILEGRVEVTVGKENLVFESGPFSHYGSQALTSYSSAMESASSTQLSRSVQSVRMAVSPDGGVGSAARGQTFVTDYTVRAITDVVYFCLSRILYQAARSATVLERTQRGDATKRISDCDSNLEHVLIFSNGEEAIGSGDHTLNENSPLITQGGYCTDYLMSDTTAIALDSRQEDLLNGPSLPAQSSFLIGENPGN